MFDLWQELGTIAVPLARFYLAEIVVALRYLHGMDVVRGSRSIPSGGRALTTASTRARTLPSCQPRLTMPIFVRPRARTHTHHATHTRYIGTSSRKIFCSPISGTSSSRTLAAPSSSRRGAGPRTTSVAPPSMCRQRCWRGACMAFTPLVTPLVCDCVMCREARHGNCCSLCARFPFPCASHALAPGRDRTLSVPAMVHVMPRTSGRWGALHSNSSRGGCRSEANRST